MLCAPSRQDTQDNIDSRRLVRGQQLLPIQYVVTGLTGPRAEFAELQERQKSQSERGQGRLPVSIAAAGSTAFVSKRSRAALWRPSHMEVWFSFLLSVEQMISVKAPTQRLKRVPYGVLKTKSRRLEPISVWDSPNPGEKAKNHQNT
jgi:hypothetical protein